MTCRGVIFPQETKKTPSWKDLMSLISKTAFIMVMYQKAFNMCSVNRSLSSVCFLQYVKPFIMFIKNSHVIPLKQCLNHHDHVSTRVFREDYTNPKKLTIRLSIRFYPSPFTNHENPRKLTVDKGLKRLIIIITKFSYFPSLSTRKILIFGAFCRTH